MTDRVSLRTAFLAKAGWADAVISDLAGDASNRRYFRLHQGSSQAVLMDAPPEKGEDVRPFIEIAGFMRAQDLSAPEIFAEDRDAGFLLLEDLGDALFARVVASDPACEGDLYAAAIDVLIALHQTPVPKGLAAYDKDLMADLSALAFDWYASTATGGDFAAVRERFATEFAEFLTPVAAQSDVLIQRDYHAENLIWLPSRDGVARVGLLDFQDALTGHRAYDLVSLLQDARRDVSPDLERAMIDRYVRGSGVDRTSFEAAYALLGLQRNLRIIGVFARLCVRDGKPHYVDLIPRVWAHMVRDLKKVEFANLETVLLANLPPPDEQTLALLREKCGTIPTQS